MGKYRFREYDALGLKDKVPGDKVASAHHISKRKLKQKDVEVVFDVKDYKDYVTGFRKRKQQRRQDALKQIKVKQRQERNEKRSEKRTNLKKQLGLGDDYGIKSSSDDDEENLASAQPQSVTVYRGEEGLTTTVTTMALQSSDGEEPQDDSNEEEEEGDDKLGAVTVPDPSSGRRGAAVSGSTGPGKRALKRDALRREKGGATHAKRPSGGGLKNGPGKKGSKGISKKRR